MDLCSDLVAVLVGIVCASVGSYLMVQRLALLGDAISHSVLPGLAIAFIVGADIFVGAFIAGIVSTIVITWIRTRSQIKEDAAIGVVASISGMYLSYFYNLPSGSAIVLVAFGFFMLAFLFSPSQGILTHPRSKAAGQSQLWREIKGLWR